MHGSRLRLNWSLAASKNDKLLYAGDLLQAECGGGGQCRLRNQIFLQAKTSTAPQWLGHIRNNTLPLPPAVNFTNIAPCNDDAR